MLESVSSLRPDVASGPLLRHQAHSPGADVSRRWPATSFAAGVAVDVATFCFFELSPFLSRSLPL